MGVAKPNFFTEPKVALCKDPVCPVNCASIDSTTVVMLRETNLVDNMTIAQWHASHKSHPDRRKSQ